jgi:serine phosphatase RsbU (regulator of sigma subunit)
MEIWSGNRLVENVVSSPGIDGWIYSKPYRGQASGGDVHYLSLCVGGIATRLVLADVAGHGEVVTSTSKALRALLRRFMNVKNQDRLVAEINNEFTRKESNGRFATAIVASFLSHKRKLLLTNAGHPRPLIYRSAHDQWKFLDNTFFDSPGSACNFPLGVVDDSTYQHFTLDIRSGDWLLLYTDALTEASDVNDQQLGEAGLKEIAGRLNVNATPQDLGHELLRSLGRYSNTLDADDTTIIALRFGHDFRRPGFLEKLRGYSKLFLK